MNILISAIAGIAMGVFFYGGLWFTVRHLVTTRHPVLLTLASFWGRTLVTLAAFLLVVDGRWENALAALAGFGLGRVLVSPLSRKGETPRCT
jgi:F1F0 ATPase subunit 2